MVSKAVLLVHLCQKRGGRTSRREARTEIYFPWSGGLPDGEDYDVAPEGAALAAAPNFGLPIARASRHEA